MLYTSSRVRMALTRVLRCEIAAPEKFRDDGIQKRALMVGLHSQYVMFP